GITSSQFRIAFGVAWSVASAGSVRGRCADRTFDLDERPVGSKSPSMAERQAKVVCLLPECSRCALHGACNLLNWRVASRVCPQLSEYSAPQWGQKKVPPSGRRRRTLPAGRAAAPPRRV